MSPPPEGTLYPRAGLVPSHTPLGWGGPSQPPSLAACPQVMPPLGMGHPSGPLSSHTPLPALRVRPQTDPQTSSPRRGDLWGVPATPIPSPGGAPRRVFPRGWGVPWVDPCGGQGPVPGWIPLIPFPRAGERFPRGIPPPSLPPRAWGQTLGAGLPRPAPGSPPLTPAPPGVCRDPLLTLLLAGLGGGSCTLPPPHFGVDPSGSRAAGAGAAAAIAPGPGGRSGSGSCRRAPCLGARARRRERREGWVPQKPTVPRAPPVPLAAG